MISQEQAVATRSTWVVVANVWFVAWAIRRRGEFDYELDTTAKFIRWLVAITCLGTATQLPQLLNPPSLRVCVAFAGLGFLVWPNFAYYLTKLLRYLRILRRHDHGPAGGLT